MTDDTPLAPMHIIDQFLQANLLSTLGSDEQRYKHIAQATEAVEARLASAPGELIAFSQVAFQPTPDASEPALALVYDALKAHWKLIDNVYAQERPVTLLRAVMLEVVSRLCARNDRLASIVYHSNASAFAYHRYGHGEAAIISSILQKAGEVAEAFAVKAFFNSPVENAPAIKVEIPTPPAQSMSVDMATLQDGLVAAVGPHDPQGKPPKMKPPNSQWSSQGWPSWSYEYPPIAARAIGGAIDQAVQTGLKALANSASTAVTTSLSAIVKDVHRVPGPTPKLQNMLWWMQALYSPSLRRSYRDLDVAAAAVTMAHDLMGLDVVPCPESVIHFLGEATRNAVADHEPQNRAPVTLARWLQRLSADDAGQVLRSRVGAGSALPPRAASLLAVVRASLHGHTIPPTALGALSEAEVTPRQLAMWLFRDLVAERLARQS